MSRKHFEAIAATFAVTRPASSGAQRKQWTYDVKEMARTLAEFNSRFDRERFIEACGA